MKTEARRARVVALLVTAGIPPSQAEAATDNLSFGDDMLAAGFTLRTYEPRAWDTRTAVRCDDGIELQTIIRATSVVLDWDTLGMGYIVYPRSRA